jgi:hypothetical protein
MLVTRQNPAFGHSLAVRRKLTASFVSYDPRSVTVKHRLVALAALAAVSLTGGCGLIESAAAQGSPSTTSTAAPTKAVPTPGSKTGADTGSEGSDSVKESGDIPDPCTLLSTAEVSSLTGRPVTQVDEDGGTPGDITRYCQWQQEGGQLAVFLSRTTPADFQVTVAEAEWVDGVGEDAYWHSGHLFVLSGTAQLDVYSRGAADDQNVTDARNVAKTLLPRI